jgi:hypothetical protein
MGTRGSVAWKRSNGTWTGVYNHFDSYPEGLGSELWHTLEGMQFDIPGLIAKLKKVRRWENLNDHIDRKVDPDNKLFNPRKDPLYIEWVYVLDPIHKLLEVWTNVSVPITKKIADVEDYDRVGCRYTHVKVATIKVGDAEPDWEKIHKIDAEKVLLGRKDE